MINFDHKRARCFERVKTFRESFAMSRITVFEVFFTKQIFDILTRNIVFASRGTSLTLQQKHKIDWEILLIRMSEVKFFKRQLRPDLTLIWPKSENFSTLLKRWAFPTDFALVVLTRSENFSTMLKRRVFTNRLQLILKFNFTKKWEFFDSATRDVNLY